MNYTLYRPCHLSSGVLEEAERSLTWVAGGSTRFSCWGEYLDTDKLIRERIFRTTYIVSRKQRTAFYANVQRWVDELHRLGEKSVLVEEQQSEVHFYEQS